MLYENTMNNTTNENIINENENEFHNLSNKWTLWAHLPKNNDWSINSYISIFTFTTIEETIAVIDSIPPVLVEKCMLFLMKDGVLPTWEDTQNRNGGCFSYKILNKNAYNIWRDLSYVLVGSSISKNINFVNSVSGITISPKKNFCIFKIWMTDCTNQNPSVITNNINGFTSHGCLFKKHAPEY